MATAKQWAATLAMNNPGDTRRHDARAAALDAAEGYRPPAEATRLTLAVPDELIGRIAEHAADIVVARLGTERADASPYLTVSEAADYMRAKPQRIYDLLSARRLRRFKDGSRVLLARAELEAYLDGTGVAPVLPRRSTTA